MNLQSEICGPFLKGILMGVGLSLLVGSIGLIDLEAQAQSSQTASRQNQSTKKPKERLKNLSEIKVPGLKFSEKIPSNFPIPEYPRNVLKKSFIHSTKGSPTATANIITKDSSQVVFRWYQAVCKRGGWKIRVPKEQTLSSGKNSKMYMLDAVKGHNSVSITCYKCMDPSFKGTSVNIAWAFLK